jgi:glycosyltransferase involved in cell wall biosynthesis
MCPTKDHPFQGQFVRQQYESLKANCNANVFEYFHMPKKAREKKSFISRYATFTALFIKAFFFKKMKFDVIHVHFFFPTMILAYLYKIFCYRKVKIIATFHGSDIYHYEPASKAYKFFVNQLSHLIFVSHHLKNRFYKQVQHSSVISAGISDIFSQNRNPIVFDFIFVGHFDENKGVLRLLDALNKIVDLTLNVAIVGEGPLKKEVDYFLGTTHHNIKNFGFLSQQKLLSLYNESRFLVNLSEHESFGLVMAEAMACGTLVIASDTDGSKEQIIDQKNGFVVGNVNADNFEEKLINKILYSLHYPSYEQMKDNAVSHSQEQKLSVVSKKINSIYEK